MKTENNIIPDNFVIENIDLEKNKCDLIINTDIEEIEKEEDGKTVISYLYQSYRTSINYDENLNNELQTDEGYEKWLKKLKNIEKNKKATEEREWRNAELSNSDKYMLKDYPSEYTEKTILKYRQALRDYPNTEDFPFGTRPKITNF